MLEHCWGITLRGSMFRRLPPGYLVRNGASHRLLRYGSSGGPCRLALLASSLGVVGDVRRTVSCSQVHVALVAAAAAGVGIAPFWPRVIR